ncbi:hypothetical protein [Tenacibaculum jejuense]|uniref:Uncharacterized protein n=1 Tax=Tenacibaculum jejuense TaxID=584609 RepID=A0A238UBW4_9FLAO|nr:hypothetical protein [Tenacibaculum jejuense]SNR16693.1 protein of unknown function [Tenacibaculum jejuense]
MSYIIKINCKAEGENSFSEEIVIPKTNLNKELELHDCKNILKSLTSTLTSLKEKDEIYEFNYTIKIICNEEKLIDGEMEFFKIVVQYEQLLDFIIDYVNTASNGKYGIRIWEDCETPLGNGAMISLVETDKKYIQSYIDFLRTCDLDHEVCQWGDIDSVISKYGFNEETVKLAIARLMSCAGQSGKEQFTDFLDKGLETYLADNKELFLTALVAETNYSLYNCNYYHNCLEASKDEFINEVIDSIKELVAKLDKSDIDFFKKELIGIWKNYRVLQ